MDSIRFRILNLTNSYLTDYSQLIRLKSVSTTTKAKANSVWFTIKGQVVIPSWLRKQFHIKDGTKAIVEATPEGILLKPVTAISIRRLRGILKRKPGDKPFAEQWAGHKREEMELEEAKYVRSTGGSR